MSKNVKTDPEFEEMINELIENPRGILTMPYDIMIDFIYALYISGYIDLTKQVMAIAIEEYGARAALDMFSAPEKFRRMREEEKNKSDE